jgi:hypothetical protein
MHPPPPPKLPGSQGERRMCSLACTHWCMQVKVPRAALRREREPEPRGHVVAPELPRAGSGSSSRGDTWRPWSYPEPGAGARAVGTRGGPRAAPSRERKLEPRGHVAASELPSAGRRESLS